jgi:hypothetical protein
MKHSLFIVLLIAILMTAGCVRENRNTDVTPTGIPTQTPTTMPTTTMPTTTLTVVTRNTTPAVTPNETITQTVTVKPTPIPDVTAIDAITFLTWSDELFSISYPNTWTVEQKTENETKNLGNTKNKLFKRFVFYNPGRTVAYTITIWDIGVGPWVLDESDRWWLEDVQAQFPTYNAMAITGFTKNCALSGLNRRNCMRYTVTTPEIKLFRYIACTLRYGYTFELISDPVKYDMYENLGEYMTGTIKLSDTKSA